MLLFFKKEVLTFFLLSLAAAAPIISAARGQALFDGREPLSGRLRDHATLMPPAVLACGNCHGSRSSQTRLPKLTAVSLLTPTVRRGGPPSAYDLASFCRVLRTGADPVYVVLSRAMPLYQLSRAQCESLWLYAMKRKAA